LTGACDHLTPSLDPDRPWIVCADCGEGLGYWVEDPGGQLQAVQLLAGQVALIADVLVELRDRATMLEAVGCSRLLWSEIHLRHAVALMFPTDDATELDAPIPEPLA